MQNSTVRGTEKNLNFFNILVCIPTKHDMVMTNINFIFDQFHPCDRKTPKSGKT